MDNHRAGLCTKPEPPERLSYIGNTTPCHGLVKNEVRFLMAAFDLKKRSVVKCVFISLISGFLLVFALLFVINLDGNPAAAYSYTGIWVSKDEKVGEEFEVSFSDSYLTVNGLLMKYNLKQREDWLLFVAEDSSGQVPSNKITFLFEIKGKNKLELLSVGTEPVSNKLLTRK